MSTLLLSTMTYYEILGICILNWSWKRPMLSLKAKGTTESVKEILNDLGWIFNIHVLQMSSVLVGGTHVEKDIDIKEKCVF